ncbi:hypothetical protein Y032_0031g2253 [Ancylostoma ceylanicum]|uniref:Uncharacterized protein n=2 Tax=Ancylostoma ceylanicum TaxID=53326 RepID=A0A016URF8_9BILA|nr:hypothetical protein Y032_0031g2253 [Ancylostoma ceylanicum]
MLFSYFHPFENGVSSLLCPLMCLAGIVMTRRSRICCYLQHSKPGGPLPLTKTQFHIWEEKRAFTGISILSSLPLYCISCLFSSTGHGQSWRTVLDSLNRVLEFKYQPRHGLHLQTMNASSSRNQKFEYRTTENGCVSCGEEGRNQVAPIGAVGPSVTPICLNTNGINPIYGLIVLIAVRVKQMGVFVPIRVAWLRLFFPHDDTHHKQSIDNMVRERHI